MNENRLGDLGCSAWLFAATLPVFLIGRFGKTVTGLCVPWAGHS